MNTSIIIPTFNEAVTIAKTLESILQQIDEKTDEIIIVDNNSTDNTCEIIKKYPVNLIHEKNQGVTFAREAGFNNAKGKIIIFTDSDCIVSNNWLSEIKKSFLDKNTIALAGKVLIKHSETKEFIFRDNFYWKKFTPFLHAINKPILWGANCAFCKDAIKPEYFRHDLNSYEDFILGRKIAKHKKRKQKIVFNPNAIVIAFDTPTIIPKRTLLDHILAEFGIFRKRLKR